MPQLPKLVILDRDGVVNRDSDEYIKSPAEWVPLGGSLEAIARLNHAGIRVAIASNQSGIARGLFTLDDLNRIHAKLHQRLARVGGHVDGIFFCPHGPDDGCDCRKPRAGLLREIGRRFGIALDGVPVIGDSRRDAEAALAVQAQPIVVRTGNGAGALAHDPMLATLPWFDDLEAAVEAILAGRSGA
jgi:D-glycero-D-manno-heptose 1,7-bisphosphate phosphatase